MILVSVLLANVNVYGSIFRFAEGFKFLLSIDYVGLTLKA